MEIRGFSLEGSAWGAKLQKTESGSRSRRAIPSTAGLVNCKSGKITCVFCEGAHTSKSCSKAQILSFAEKRSLAVKRGCCFAYLKPGHRDRRCRAVLRCVMCNGRHVSVMCMPTEKVSDAKEAPVIDSSLSNIDCSLHANYDGNAERGKRQASESAHGPGVPAILCQEGYGKVHELRTD